MLKLINRYFIFIYIFFILQSFLQAKEIELKLCYQDAESYPWQLGDGESTPTPPGIALDIISNAAKELQLKFTFTRTANKRVFYNLQNGLVDGAFIFSFKEERLQSGAYPMKNGKVDHNRRIATINHYFYKNKSSDITWDGKQLTEASGSVGVNRGYSIVDDLKKLNIPIEESKGTEILLKKLESNRISAYAGQDVTIDYFISKLKLKDIIKIEPAINSKDYFLVLSRNFVHENPQLAEKIWDKIGEIREKVTAEKLPLYSN